MATETIFPETDVSKKWVELADIPKEIIERHGPCLCKFWTAPLNEVTLLPDANKAIYYRCPVHYAGGN